jgi:hypothetical protein
MRVELIAGPAPANPPFFIALAIILAGLVAPFLFLRATPPSPLLGVAALALGLAGIFALAGAIHGRRRVLSDPTCRIRACISTDGIALFKTPPPATGQFFPADQIVTVHLVQGALVIQAAETFAKPGRHAIRFGKLRSPPGPIIAAIKTFQQIERGSL